MSSLLQQLREAHRAVTNEELAKAIHEELTISQAVLAVSQAREETDAERPVHQEVLLAAFKMMDMNNNGFITRAEMIKAVSSQPVVRQLLGLDAFRQGSEGHTAFKRQLEVSACDCLCCLL